MPSGLNQWVFSHWSSRFSSLNARKGGKPLSGRSGIIGIPFATAYPPNPQKANRLVADAPSTLRRAIVGEQWIDYGDVSLLLPVVPVTPDQVIDLMDTIRLQVAPCIEEMDFTLILGGECYIACATLPVIRARYPNCHVLWFDAHPDFLNERNSRTNFLDGMSLARVLGCAGSQEPVLDTDQVTLLGGQDAEAQEIVAMNRGQIHWVQATEIERWAEQSLPPGDLFVHLDVDILDPEEMPAVDFPSTSGVAVAALQKVLQTIADTSRLRGIEVCCYNQALDPDQRGLHALRSLLEVCLP
ncbi:MAG: arginase family protein [Firmicutes bacterium]|nr:arginase family protein [Bacillota bacterium]